MKEAVQRHCAEIERCNQRGGRMLSVVDLLDAGTLDFEVAAHCLAAIQAGASFMIGALPGGAGKTTVMGALLNFVGRDVGLAAADGIGAIEHGLAASAPRRCFICHEIGRGSYYAYLWGEELRRYFELPAAGHQLATNLHADTFEQARDQVCGDNGVAEEAFRRMNLILFLQISRSMYEIARRVVSVWESDGSTAHACVLDRARGLPLVAKTALVSTAARAAASEKLRAVAAAGARTIGAVREALVTA